MTTTRRWSRRVGPGGVAIVLGALSLMAVPGLAAQSLADYDYEHLAFRGVGLEAGYIFPNNVENTYTVSARMDLGYLGPGLRIVPGVSFWESSLVGSEVRKLEDRLADLVVREAPPGTPRPDVSLSPIDWSDLVLSLDGHFVWSIPYGVLTYAGAGGSAHLMNGKGPAIDDTFIEDLLDSVRAGFNFHGGLELPVHENFRIHTAARYEFLGDLRYAELRVGGQFLVGPDASVRNASR